MDEDAPALLLDGQGRVVVLMARTVDQPARPGALAAGPSAAEGGADALGI
jgi:hypothetical protein